MISFKLCGSFFGALIIIIITVCAPGKRSIIHLDLYIEDEIPYVPRVLHNDPLSDQEKSLTFVLEASFNVHPDSSKWWAKHILLASHLHNVPPELLKATIAAESHFRKHAISRVGAVGPMQIRPEFWQHRIIYNIYDPAQNIIAGALILSTYKGKCPGRTWACAVASYNIGITNYKQGMQQKAAHRYLNKIRKNLVKVGESSVDFEGI